MTPAYVVLVDGEGGICYSPYHGIFPRRFIRLAKIFFGEDAAQRDIVLWPVDYNARMRRVECTFAGYRFPP